VVGAALVAEVAGAAEAEGKTTTELSGATGSEGVAGAH
jgi:hypothetical protein